MMKVREAGSEKLKMLNEGWSDPQQMIVMTGRCPARFFVNEKSLDSCLPTLGSRRLTRPYLLAHSMRHLLAPFLFSFLSVSTSVWYCHSSRSR